jgi:hypothetical protein
MEVLNILSESVRKISDCSLQQVVLTDNGVYLQNCRLGLLLAVYHKHVSLTLCHHLELPPFYYLRVVVDAQLELSLGHLRLRVAVRHHQTMLALAHRQQSRLEVPKEHSLVDRLLQQVRP